MKTMLVPKESSRREGGFSLIELLVVILLGAILMGMAAFGLRQFWLTQSLYGGRDDVVGQLRRAQEQAVSESHPKVFGARFKVGSAQWSAIEYDPTVSPATCREIGLNTFAAGTVPTSASFTATDETTTCSSTLTNLTGAAHADRASSVYVFFYARGTATPGSVVLGNPVLTGRSVSVTVSPITGRVTAS